MFSPLIPVYSFKDESVKVSRSNVNTIMHLCGITGYKLGVRKVSIFLHLSITFQEVMLYNICPKKKTSNLENSAELFSREPNIQMNQSKVKQNEESQIKNASYLLFISVYTISTTHVFEHLVVRFAEHLQANILISFIRFSSNILNLRNFSLPFVSMQML